MEALSRAADLERRQVEAEIGDFEHAHAAATAGTRDDRFEADLEFLEVERLGQVIVRTGTKPGDLVRQFIARGQHEHGNVAACLAQRLQHMRSGHSRQHPVEHDRVIGLSRREMQAGASVGRSVEDMAARFEIVEQVGDQAAVVLDDEQTHRTSQPGRDDSVHQPPTIAGDPATAPPRNARGSPA